MVGKELTLYQSMTHICVMSSHKPIRIYMGGLILCTGFSASLSCFLWSVKGKDLITFWICAMNGSMPRAQGHMFESTCFPTSNSSSDE